MRTNFTGAFFRSDEIHFMSVTAGNRFDLSGTHQTQPSQFGQRNLFSHFTRKFTLHDKVLTLWLPYAV